MQNEIDNHLSVPCAVCGERFPTIHYRHLKKHGLTVAQYKTLYPTHPLRSVEATQRKTQAAIRANASRKGVPRSASVKQKISNTKRRNPREAWNKGIPMSDEQRERLSQIRKDGYASGSIVHWNLGKTTPQETRDKISSTLTSRGRTYSELSKQKRAVTMQRKRDNGWQHHSTTNRGIKVTDPEVLEKIRAASRRTNQARIRKGIEELYSLCAKERLTIIDIEDNYWLTMACNICDTKFTYTRQVFRKSSNRAQTNICPTCFPRQNGTSSKEKELADYVKQLVGDRQVLCNDRSYLKGKEIDILIPHMNLGIEFNGLYWHSELNFKGHKHHLLHKQQYAYKCGVRLIHIFEDEWDQKQELVKSRLRHLLTNTSQRIHARNCVIKQIDSKQKNLFLQQHHIMGDDVSAIRYGAFYNDQLVGVMTFSLSNFVKGGDGSVYELNRFATKQDTRVVGLASKMFTRFVRDYSPQEVVSYCDRRWNQGNTYKLMGFKFVGSTPPNYWYMYKYADRKHRSNYMKHKISNHTNEKLTEWQIMQDDGYDRIWDCGNLKFVWSPAPSQS